MGLESLVGWDMFGGEDEIHVDVADDVDGPMSKPDEPKMRMNLWAWGAYYSSGDMSGGEDEIHMLLLQMMLMGPMSKPDEPKMRMSLWAWGA